GLSCGGGPGIRGKIAARGIERVKDRIREIRRRAGSAGLKQLMSVLAPYLRGWRGYCGFCETPDELIQLTGWVRRRLRTALWQQWKTRKRRRAMLIQLGVRGALADSTAGSSRGPWHIAHTKALSIALSNE